MYPVHCWEVTRSPRSHLVARFDAQGLAALDPRHGGGSAPIYDQVARGRIFREARRQPTPEADGTASWGLTTLREALRHRAP